MSFVFGYRLTVSLARASISAKNPCLRRGRECRVGRDPPDVARQLPLARGAREGTAEPATRLILALDPGDVLVPELVGLLAREDATGAEAGSRRAVDHVDRPGSAKTPDVLKRDAYGQVVTAITVEVPGGKGSAADWID